MVLAFVLLSELTKAWLLYLGLVFMLMVMYAPGGIASLIMMNLRVAAFGKLRRLLPLVRGAGARRRGDVRRRGGDDRDGLPPAARRGARPGAEVPAASRSTCSRAGQLGSAPR